MPFSFVFLGIFLYIEASGKPLGYRARLKSGIIEESGTSDTGHCLSFYYHMFGVGIGELNIYIVLLHDGKQTLIWSKYGNQGHKWHHGMVSFVSSLPHQVSSISLAAHFILTSERSPSEPHPCDPLTLLKVKTFTFSLRVYMCMCVCVGEWVGVGWWVVERSLVTMRLAVKAVSFTTTRTLTREHYCRNINLGTLPPEH